MLNRSRLAASVVLSVSIAVNAFGRNDAASSEFRDPTPQERAMTSVAFAPGASAVILNWDQFVNDRDFYRSEYMRIKILTEQGKKYADVEVPHVALFSDVTHIKARTVRPDGTIAPFDGRTFDKVVVKVGGVRLVAKTFTLPDVQVGSIIEYRYDLSSRANMLYDTKFAIQRDLPIVHEEISLQPYAYGDYRTFFSFRGLPNGKKPEFHGQKYDLELDDIPPFEEEPYSPPEAMIRPELQFWYTSGTTEPAAFWTKQAHEWADIIEPFIGDSREVREASAAAVAGAPTAEDKLRKLYARAQQIRNLSFEPDKSEAETRKLHDNRSAQDVIRNGYGDLRDINRLFVAMARAAGFDAHVIRIGERDEQFLARNVPVGNQLDGEVALVTVDGKKYFLDPSTPFAPFGTLSWQKTSTEGLLIARKQEQAEWVETPRQGAEAATTRRTAVLHLDNGVVRGAAVITYRGQEALRKRFALRNDDEAAARKSLEETVKGWFPDGAVVKLTEVSDLHSSDAPLTISANVELPSVVSLVGSRAMVPLAVFAGAEKNPFSSEQRKRAIYFHYAYGVEDDVTFKLPAGYDIESLPEAADVDMGALHYVAAYKKEQGAVHMGRKMFVNTEMIGRDKYAAVRSFFSKAAALDQEQVVLRKSTAQAGSAH
jgi:hypothetical protein